MDDLGRFASLVRGARNGVAFTGAGISTESGIPDFRSAGGIWSQYTPVLYNDFLSDRSERVRGWKFGAAMFRECAGARPNAGHKVIAELERRGHVTAVVTQNIDGLHHDAGSTNVIELHGTNRFVACQSCGKQWPTPVVVARWEQGDEAPDCDDCGGPLKTGTVSFGQAMPEHEMRRAADVTLKSDLYIAIGSSLVVEPAASFPRMAKRAGAKLVILNNAPTPLDEFADLVVNDQIGKTMQALLERLDRQAPISR